MALLFDNTTAVTGITATPATTPILGLAGSLVLTLETEIPVVVSTVGGTPALTLSNGGRASYSGLDDGGRPQFTYRPAAGEDTGNLTVTGLITNGGSIRGRERTSFTSAGDVTVGNGAFSVTTADLNGDRRPDLLVANSGSGTVSVRLGVGNGTFAPAPDVKVGMAPVSVTTADLNGDRRPDLLVANLVSSTVSVRLGAGDGTFTSAADVGVGLRPSSVMTADVNGDGRPDLLVADQFGERVSVRLGKGDGTFTQGEDPVASYSSSVTTADLNGDGSQDLLVANPGDRTVTILGGVGDGTFSMSLRPIRFAVGGNPTSVTTADVNGDGRPDILVANQGSGTVSVLVKTGGSSLIGFTRAADVSVGSSPTSVATADVNRDGRQDLLVANQGSGTVSVRLGVGDGTFTSTADLTVGSNPRSVTTADVDSDGRQDILVADSGNGTVSVLLNTSLGSTEFDFASVGTAPGAATGIGIDATRPAFGAGSVNGAALVLTYGEALDAANPPAASTFTVTAGGTEVGVAAVAVDAAARTVTLTLAQAVAQGQVVTVAYADPSTSDDARAIQDAAGNDAASLTATAVTNTTDTTPPQITAVSVPNQTARIGHTVTATITVASDGDTYTLGAGSTIAGYNLGSLTRVSSTSYTASFTVAPGTDIAAGASLPVNLVLRDSAGNANTAYTTSITQAGDPIDATRPVFSVASVNGATLVLTYGEGLDATNPPAAGTFTVTAGGTGVGVNAVAVDAAAKTVTLTLAQAVAQGQAVTVAYADPTAGDDARAIQDAAGNDATSLLATPVINTTDSTPPVFSAGSVNGASLMLTYGEALDAGNKPAASAFTVIAGGTGIGVEAVAVDAAAKTVTLTLAHAVAQGQAVTVAYADPSAGDDARAIQDAAGNDAASLPATAVINTTPAPPPRGSVEPPVSPTTQTGGGSTSLTTTADPAAAAGAATQAVQNLPASLDKAAVAQAVSGFLTGLAPGTRVNVSTFTPTPGAANISLTGPTDGTQSLVVLDASTLPPGTPITLNNVGFVVLSGPASLVGGDGAQVVYGDDAAQSMVLGADDDTLRGGGGNDVVGSKGGNDLLYGDAGNDTVLGGTGNDTLFGGTEQDLVYGNQDADLIYGNQGADSLYGGQGDDRAYGGQGDDRIWGNAGADRLFGNAGADLVYGNQGADVIYGNQGADTLFGGQEADTLFGGQDADVVYGNLGADLVYGNLGNDVLYGGQGNDVLYGGQGDDILVGDLGDDILVGGLGADRYVFGAQGGRDLIRGFDQGAGDRLVQGGQGYTLSTSQNGDALLVLSGGGSVELAGIRAAQVSAGFFATA